MYTPDRFSLPPADDAVLWRYMGFTKFVSLLERSALYFCRIDSLGDPFEGSILGSTPPVVLAVQSLEEKERGSKIPKPTPINLEGIARATFVNCWHESDVESDAMWKLYASYGEGVAIRTAFRQLADAFVGQEPVVSIGKIEYKDYTRDRINVDPLRLCFYKRRSFEHEREVRAVVRRGGDSTATGFYVDVDLNALVSEIVVAPFAEQWFIDLVSGLADRSGLGQVVRSSLTGEPVFDASLVVFSRPE